MTKRSNSPKTPSSSRSNRRKKSRGAKRKVVEADEYKVGYGRPPKATQFPKGVSGNPKGRPKGMRPVGAPLQEILRQRVTVTESGRTRRLPALEVMLRRLTNDAMRSDKTALKTVLALVDRYGQSTDTELQTDELIAEDRAILERYLK
jgi:Family of unknown function (DUF5681)